MSITTPSSFSGHILGIAGPAWGHLKPLVGLASKIVQERSDIIFTFLTVGEFSLRVEEEINRYFPGFEDSSESSRCNIRVINIGGEESSLTTLWPLLAKNFGPIYSILANSEPVLSANGKLYDSPLRPSLAIVDVFLPDIICDIRKTTVNGSDVRVLGWNTLSATFSLRMTGLEVYGGYGDVETKARELAATTGRDVAAIEKELCHCTTGAVVSIPGMPSIFDYEFTPQETFLQEFHVSAVKRLYRFMALCDGMIASTSAAFEPEAHEAWKKWLAETNRAYYILGPLQPQGFHGGTFADSMKQSDLNSSQNGRELSEFLDNMLQTQGSNSLLYISFGTIFWPKEEYIFKLIDVLLELKFPFILTHSSPKASIPAEVTAKVKASGLGTLSPWAPQQLILAHPATGWFLTHCGQNSVTEATTQGIPIIAWPFESDQPINAARVSLTLDMAFELMEVRTGHGLKPLYRGISPKGTIEAVEAEFYEVLRNAKGPVGDRKRRNAHVLRDAMIGAWAEGSDSIQALRKMLNNNFP